MPTRPPCGQEDLPTTITSRSKDKTPISGDSNDSPHREVQKTTNFLNLNWHTSDALSYKNAAYLNSIVLPKYTRSQYGKHAPSSAASTAEWVTCQNGSTSNYKASCAYAQHTWKTAKVFWKHYAAWIISHLPQSSQPPMQYRCTPTSIQHMGYRH